MGRFIASLAAVLVGCSFDGTPASQFGDAGSADGTASPDGGGSVDGGSDASGDPVTLTFQDGQTYSGTHDTMVDGQSATTVNSADVELQWDFDADHWVLLRFGSIIGAADNQIPPGATVTAATLRIMTSDSSDSNSPGRMRRVLIPWVEDVSFEVFAGDGQIDATEMDTSSFIDAPTAVGAHQLDVTAAVSGWVGDPATNHGWIFEPTSTNGISMFSSEADAALRPALEVTFVR